MHTHRDQKTLFILNNVIKVGVQWQSRAGVCSLRGREQQGISKEAEEELTLQLERGRWLEVKECCL